MIISDLEEETEDIDWFATDSSGAIAHFATGGMGFLPQALKESAEAVAELSTFFWSLPAINATPLISKTFETHVQIKSENDRNRYLADFRSMASKGLFSFSYLQASKRPTAYFLVTLPSQPLRLADLPNNIQQLLERVSFSGTFLQRDLVDKNSFK